MSTAQSPAISYLFGGLAAMLGLIAFALLILACSYWKLSGYIDNGENSDSNRDIELGDEKTEEKQKVPYEEKFLVIMAGQALPTFLATPITNRTSSLVCNCGSTSGKLNDKLEHLQENEKQENCDPGTNELVGDT